MISSEPFSSRGEPDICPKCGGPLTWRQKHGYPVLAQALFGLSFVGFLVLFEKVKDSRVALWGWSLVQALLGAWLLRGRVRAKERILRCIRCGADLR